MVNVSLSTFTINYKYIRPSLLPSLNNGVDASYNRIGEAFVEFDCSDKILFMRAANQLIVCNSEVNNTL